MPSILVMSDVLALKILDQSQAATLLVPPLISPTLKEPGLDFAPQQQQTP